MYNSNKFRFPPNPIFMQFNNVYPTQSVQDFFTAIFVHHTVQYLSKINAEKWATENQLCGTGLD